MQICKYFKSIIKHINNIKFKTMRLIKLEFKILSTKRSSKYIRFYKSDVLRFFIWVLYILFII